MHTSYSIIIKNHEFMPRLNDNGVDLVVASPEDRKFKIWDGDKLLRRHEGKQYLIGK